MSEPTTPGVVARVAAALAEPDPERALLLALSELGFVAEPEQARRLREAERQQLEEQMQRAQRLESLGVLATGVAHDLNNLLVGVLGNAELLLQSVRNEAEYQAIEAIRASGQRAAVLTTQLLTYAGQRERDRRDAIDLAAMWRELGELTEAASSKRAKWRLAIEPQSVVLGERANLSQLLMNLLTNASDALGESPGAIELCARPIAAPDPCWSAALGNAVAPGNWVLIEVKDSGCGMSQETQSRIFEPFFSTKQRGRGLGLPACLSIVKGLGGAILVQSEVGRGTVVSVLLPAASARTSSVPAPPASVPAPAQRSVLVVDDELPVRTLLRRALERRGFVVHDAADGRSALAAVDGANADVIVLDMTMPDLDGAEVVRRLRASGCTTPIVLSSGYMDAALESRLDPNSFQGFLVKPFTIAELTALLERVLQTHAG